MTRVLGISALYHDSAAAIIEDNKIIAAAQEERFVRKKNTLEFPTESIKYCLKESSATIDSLDAVVFYEKPFLKFERLLETYFKVAPKGIKSFLKSIPSWVSEKLFLRKLIKNKLQEVENFNRKKLTILFCEHHLSHAASAFFTSNYDSSAILTIDAVGEWCTASISLGNKNGITTLKELNFPDSIGLLYSSFTAFLGFEVNSGEYKLMGLSSYGDSKAKSVIENITKIKSEIVDIKEDGSIQLNNKYFTFSYDLNMFNRKRWEKLFEMPSRKKSEEIKQKHIDLSLAIQLVTEEITLKLAAEAKRITGQNKLCLAGGVALNCVSNSNILNSGIFNSIYVQPAAGDAGGALGAALAAYHIHFNNVREISNNTNDIMNGTYLGPKFSDGEIKETTKKLGINYIEYAEFDRLINDVTDFIIDGKIIGWFQGRMEFGPRALGNRSILADPRNPKMLKKINSVVKDRELFRPLAPSVLEEDAADYFNLNLPSYPYMTFTANINNQIAYHTNQYKQLDYQKKLAFEKSKIPAVTHVDYTSRLQTVNRNSNYKFWYLIYKFKEKTGIPVLLNTSFNRKNEPIVCSPMDAIRCFQETSLDYLVINNYLYKKESDGVH